MSTPHADIDRGTSRDGRAADLARRPGSSRRRALTALLLTSVAACGFHLRGSIELPFRSLYLPPGSTTVAEMRRYLTSTSAVKLTDKPQDAQARLDVLLDVKEKEIVAFSSTGTPREYQLRQRIRFRLLHTSGEEWMPQQEIVLRREVTTTDAELLAKQQEDIVLYQEMQTDAVQQILRRLAAAPPG